MGESKPATIVVDVAVELILLFVLWMLFVSKIERDEIYVGIAVAIIGTFADQVVKTKESVAFRPRLKQALLIVTEPWYAITGTAAIYRALARKLLGKKSEAQFTAIDYDTGGDDAESQARRALTVAYLTIPPNSIVLGIDREHDKVLIHQISPTPTPIIARKLGARE